MGVAHLSIPRHFLLFQTDKGFVYVFAYQPVRLAVPLQWNVRLISNLPKYMSLEVPLTLLSLLALPMLLSIRRHRTLQPVLPTWRTMYHLLSGEDSDSLIKSARQGTVILIVGGMISLLIQYPTNLLKGQVVSSAHVEKIRPSNCSVEYCRVSSHRVGWFGIGYADNFVGRIQEKKFLADSISAQSLKQACAQISEASIGMTNWTALAFLTQHLTVCDDPTLIKMQVSKWGRRLVFEHMSAPHATQSVCSSFTTAAGQLEPRTHYRVTQRILAHDLLRYSHVKSSLYAESPLDKVFWDSPIWKHAARRLGVNWVEPSQAKAKIVTALAVLEAGYRNHRMLDDRNDLMRITLEQMTEVFLCFLVAMLTMIVSVLFGQLVRCAARRARKT